MAVNIVALLLLLVPGVNLVVFYVANGYLLGREYFTLVAIRHLGRAGAAQMRKRHGGTIWLAGVLMAMPLSILFGPEALQHRLAGSGARALIILDEQVVLDGTRDFEQSGVRCLPARQFLAALV